MATKSWRARARRKAPASHNKVAISFTRKERAGFILKYTCSHLSYNLVCHKITTTTAINAMLHGITHSKDSFYKLGMGISYANLLFLRYVWLCMTLNNALCALMRLLRENQVLLSLTMMTFWRLKLVRMCPCVSKMPNLCHNYSVRKYLKCRQWLLNVIRFAKRYLFHTKFDPFLNFETSQLFNHCI